MAVVTLQGLELDSSNVHDACAIALLRRDDGDLKGAIRSLKRAAKRHPDQGLVWNDLADLLLAQGDAEKAVRAARRATELLPESPVPWATLGDAWTKLGRRSRSIRCYESALERDHPARARIQRQIEAARKAKRRRSDGWRGFLQRETKQFWAVQVDDQETLIRTGRVGKKGRKTTRQFASRKAALRHAEKEIEEHLAAGYREVQRG